MAWMLHWLHSQPEIMLYQQQTTGIINLKYSDYLTHEILLPPVTEQRKIAEILDGIDHGIASTEAVIAKLKLKNFGLLRALLHGVDAQARPLIDFLTAQPRNGFSPNEAESWTGVVALGLGCLTTDGFVPRQVKNVPAHDVRYAGSWLSDGDLLMSRSNTFDLVGLVGRYRDVGVPCVYPDLMMKLAPNRLVRSEFLELVLRNIDTRENIKRMSQGTSGSMVKISAGGIVKLLVRIPNLQKQDRLLSIFAAETADIQALEREKAKLRLLKQGLMDDLLTGRVRVPVASVPGT
jgi:type I restriction enzyme S subunit